MKPFLSLLKVYIAGIYDLSSFLESFKKGPKGLLKGLGIVVLALYIAASVGVMFFMQSLISYQALAPLGLQRLMLLNAAVSATVIVLLLGFVNALATYFVSGAETFLLSLPLRPRALFGAKLSLSWLTNALFSLVIVGSAAGIYAWFERPGPLFYLDAVLVVILLPLIPLVASYLILVPLLSAVRFLRRKDTILVLGGIIGIGLALGWQVIYQKTFANASNPAWIAANLSDPDGIVARFGAAYPPAVWAATALSPSSAAEGLASIGLFSLSALLPLALAIIALSGAYVRSLVGFNETAVKRIANSSSYIGRGFARSGQLKACFLREMRLMNREPSYFLNGPFVIILLPVILAVTFLTSKDSIPLPDLSSPSAARTVSLIIMALCAFMGSSTSIACTAISREGRKLSFLKSLPLDTRPFFLAKYLHSLAFALLAAVLTAAVAIPGMGIAVGPAMEGLVGGFGVSALLNLLDLFLDTAFPRLDWTNPVAAMKQNPNAIIGVLGGMGLIGGLIALGFLVPSLPAFPLLSGLASLALCAALLPAFLSWAGRRLGAVEP